MLYMERTVMTSIAMYPCDRGTGVPSGFHYYQLTPGQVRAACIYCGKLGPGPTFETTLDSGTAG